MPDCYFVIATDDAAGSGGGSRDEKAVHRDLRECARAERGGKLTTFAFDRSKKKVDAHVSYGTVAEAEAALQSLTACLTSKGHDVQDSGVAETAQDLGL